MHTIEEKQPEQATLKRRHALNLLAVASLGLILAMLLMPAPGVTRAQGPDGGVTAQAALGSAFTYQGYLAYDDEPVDGAAQCDAQFGLWDTGAGGAQLGTTQTVSDIDFNHGYFTVTLNESGQFGAQAFDGQARWLEIAVRCPAGSGDYTTLGRQALTAAPYALHSRSTGALQGYTVGATAPTAGQVLKWDGTQWLPATDEAGAGGDITEVDAGEGLSGGGVTGPVTLTVAFAGSGSAGTAARSDHDHDGVYSLIGHMHSGADITSPVQEAVTATWATTATYAASASDANTLDGQHASVFQQRVAGSCGAGSAIRQVNADGTVTCETDDNTTYAAGNQLSLSGNTFNVVDGSGSGLDADLLDGQHASAFAGAAHTHWGQSWSGSGTGLTLSGGTTGLSGSGSTYGVSGSGNTGVVGAGGSTGVSGSGSTYGVYGSGGTNGVYGSGSTNGVYGNGSTGVYGTGNTGVVGSGGGTGVSGSGSTYGVYGGGGTYGVYGGGSTYGVYGTGSTYGVFGSSSTNGVYGSGSTGVYGNGSNYGVYATGSTGVYGTGDTGVVGSGGGTGVSGSGSTYGVYGGGGTYGVYGSGSTYGVFGSSSANGVYGSGSNNGVYGSGNTGVYGNGSTGVYGSGSTYGVYGNGNTGGYFIGTSGGNPALRADNNSGGDLIWGINSGNRSFRVASGGEVFSDGGYHCGRDDGGNASYIDENTSCMYDNSPADFAEVLAAAAQAGPGDVLAIGPDGRLTLSSTPYQSGVAGVYSTRPSYLGGAAKLGQDGYVPLAVIGVVPVKVSAENGAIRPGDLLTTSSTPGHAMKASPVTMNGLAFYPTGTIVGKALGGLERGTGVISMLVMLQ
jgi:hypothetical protein